MDRRKRGYINIKNEDNGQMEERILYKYQKLREGMKEWFK